MSFSLSAPPKYPLETEQRTGKLTNAFTTVFIAWLIALMTRVQNTSNIFAIVSVTGQSASIGATAINPDTLAAGLYRVTFYARVTTPASVSSSLSVSFGWTENGVSCSASSAPATGNTTSTADSNTILVRSDGSTLLTFSTTYASVGGTPMQYRLDVVAERIG